MKKFYLLLLGLALLFATACKDKNSTAENPLKFKTPTIDLAQYQSATVEFSNAPSGATIIFISSNLAVASVDESGKISAKSVGATYVTAFVQGDRDATITRETLTINVTNNPLKTIEISGANLMARGDTIDFLIKLDPQATVSNRDVKVVRTDSVGVKFVAFAVASAKKRENPDTLRVAGLEFGKVEFFVEQGKIKSNRLELEVTGEIKSTDFKSALTPTQIKEGRRMYNTYYTVGGDGRSVINDVDRSACDTILFDILPYNTTETNIKYEVSKPNVFRINEITLKMKEGDKEVVKKGLEITPLSVKNERVEILVTTNGGRQFTTPIYTQAPASVPAKYAEISKVKFEKNEFSLTKWGAFEYLPRVKFSYKDEAASKADTAYTNSNFVDYEFVADYKPFKGQPLSENLSSYNSHSDAVLISASFGSTGHGVAQMCVKVWNEARTEVIAKDTCNVSVYTPIESALFKSQFKFVDGKYVVSGLVNPKFNNALSWRPSIIKAELIFKKDAKAKEEIKETITLERIESFNTWYASGEFAPFADGKQLEQYSVKYSIAIDRSGKTINYSVTTSNIEVYNAAAFVAPLQ